jgi:hypothetical protein
MAEQSAGGGNFKKVLWKGFLICAGIALFASFSLGNPTCIDSEQDYRGSTCNDYANDGYKPTTEQRSANFAFWLVLLYVPVVFGAHQGKKGPPYVPKESWLS